MAKNSGLNDDRGAILIQAAFAMLALIAFASFAFDHGVMSISRNQAQNAADAGALAGATAFAFDSTDDSDTGPAKQSALAVALSNVIWGETPSVELAQGDVKICPTEVGCGPATCVAGAKCIRVDVYRNTARSNPLPMFFGSLVGLTTQNIQAMATAQVLIGNATDCLKPWAIVDKWEENWAPTSTFDKYKKAGPDVIVDPAITTPDSYTAPTESDPGTGYRPYNADGSFSSDYGRRIELTQGSQNDFEFGAGWFGALNLEDSRGGSDYGANIRGCVGITFQIGQTLEIPNQTGMDVGNTRDAVGGPDVHNQAPDSLYNQDPTAWWDESLNGGRGGVADSCCPSSPRIVAVPVVNPDLMALRNESGHANVVISNILGFFVEGYIDHKVVGRLVTMPGLMASGGATVGPESAFMKMITLVR